MVLCLSTGTTLLRFLSCLETYVGICVMNCNSRALRQLAQIEEIVYNILGTS